MIRMLKFTPVSSLKICFKETKAMQGELSESFVESFKALFMMLLGIALLVTFPVTYPLIYLLNLMLVYRRIGKQQLIAEGMTSPTTKEINDLWRSARFIRQIVKSEDVPAFICRRATRANYWIERALKKHQEEHRGI